MARIDELKEDVNDIWNAYFGKEKDFMKIVLEKFPNFTKEIETIDNYLGALETENSKLKEQVEQLKKQIK